MRDLTIGRHTIADDAPCYVLAEIGNNHQGQEALAVELIDMAADCGCHGVKFQRRTIDHLYSAELLAQPYDNPVSFGRTYGEHRHALELPLDALVRLKRHAHDRQLGFVCTAFDENAACELMYMGVDAIKLASGGATDEALVRYVDGLEGMPMLCSTGGCTRTDVERLHAWAPRAMLLHCTASYPTAWEELNLRFLEVMRTLWPEVPLGWSSHDNGIAMAIVAYCHGARLIEKHITLNHTLKGTDHAFSLEREGLRRMCRDLKRAHIALGDGVKRYYESERKPIAKMRRRLTPEGRLITGARDA